MKAAALTGDVLFLSQSGWHTQPLDMKRLLMPLPLLLTACGGATDITTNEPFQISCVAKWDNGSQTEKWFIDPTLDKAALQWIHEDMTGEQEQEVISVSPERIVVAPEWDYIPEKNNSDEPFQVFDRDIYTINRLNGNMTRESFEAKANDLPPVSFMGNKISPFLGESYECEKPSRGKSL